MEVKTDVDGSPVPRCLRPLCRGYPYSQGVVMVKRAITFLKNFFHLLNAFFRWLTSEFRMVWIACLVVAFAILVVFCVGASEFQIRLSGLVLQWFGLGTVVYGIRDTRKLFEHPSIMQLLRDKVSRIPRWRLHKIAIGDGVSVLNGATVCGRGYAWNNVNPAAPIQEQMDALKNNVESLKRQLTNLHGEMDSGLHGHSESLRQEQESRREGDERLHQRLEAAETGGLHISLMGVFWLVVGLLLSTVSPEIAQWIR
jgi:hypothetical protein